MSTNKINFFLEQINYRVRNKKLIRSWLSNVISIEDKRVGNLNIILCSDEFLYKMNIEYLNHDTLTDIITFDYSEGDFVSGELFISFARVSENAKTFSYTLVEELHRVILHGILR